MAFSYTKVGMTDNGSSNQNIVRGNVSIISGTWTAGGAANGTIVTGGAKILTAWVNNGEVHTEAPKVELNTASDGEIKLTFADATNNVGTWGAIVSNT